MPDPGSLMEQGGRAIEKDAHGRVLSGAGIAIER
jgi:hypothetical protein